MNKRKVITVTAGAALLFGLGVSVGASKTVAPASPSVFVAEVYEDSPEWNCYTDGNGVCGDAPVIWLKDGTKGAVLLDPASDGKFYVSRRDGGVEEIPRVTTELADALAEGDEPERNWEECLYYEMDEFSVVCPDGKVYEF